MVATLKITESLFPELYEAILRDWNPNLSRDQWQQAFIPRWDGEEDHFGFALADGGRIVGMLGMLFSRRIVAGRERRFCNLHCWHVKPEYRAKSLALLKPILDLKEYTITDFTPSAAVSAIARRLGFVPLDSDVLVLPPVPANGRSSGATIRELCGADDPQAALLSPGDLQIYRDHQGVDCGHLVLTLPVGARLNEFVAEEYCYVIYSRIAQHTIPYCLVHYVSNGRLFAEHHAAIRGHLLRHAQSHYVVAEAQHFAGMRVPLAFRMKARERLYRGVEIAPHEIDTLYSEMVLFKHSLLPGLRERLRTTVKRCVPATVQRYVGINVS